MRREVLDVIIVLAVRTLVSGLPANKFSGAIVTNGHECAKIGGRMLVKGGSAVDAAIAAMVCEGIAMPHNMGLGGGFVMTIYERDAQTVEVLNARETAPTKAHKDMFKNSTELENRGGLAVAVPGELRGYWEAHQRYGKLPWAELIQPSIDLCKAGHLVTPYLERAFKSVEGIIRKDPGLRKVFVNPETKKLYNEGDRIKRPKLAQTLKLIAKKGADVLYNGKLTKKFLKDIQTAGGIINAGDMKEYRPVWMTPINVSLPSNHTLYTAPLPSSGLVLTFLLNILNGFLDHSNINTVTNWQRIVESFKYGYAQRTKLGDAGFVPGIQEVIQNLTSPEFAKTIRARIGDNETYQNPDHYGTNVSLTEDHGTAHFSVLAPNGDAVSVTSTINLYFGAGFLSKSTGIVLNNQMDDFSIPDRNNPFGFPPSPSNFIRPGKRPMSSFCPSIVLDGGGDAVLVVGSASGSRIISATALVTMRHLWFGESLEDAVRNGRVHHQLFPMKLSYEDSFDKGILEELYGIGHQLKYETFDGFSTVTAISKRNNIIDGRYDWRRQGQVCFIRSSHDHRGNGLRCRN